MGRKAFVMTCGVVYGNGKEVELKKAEANFIIDSFDKLVSILINEK